jgi:hypothetical protein
MSKNFNRPIKYSGFIKNPISMTEITTIYKFHKIKQARVDLYADFVQSLCDYLFSTYMGDEVMSDDDKEKHFDWCWEKNLEMYGGMGFDLRDGNNKKKYLYFKSFFIDVFYFVNNKSETLEYNIKNVWEFIFSCDTEKSRMDVDNFLEIYKMFEESNWYK